MDERTNLLKRKMLEAVQGDLTAKSFEVAGSDSAMVAACAELLILFAIGHSDRRHALPQAERTWWNNFCDGLKVSD